MSKREKASIQVALRRAIGVLLLGATVAACDRCGDFVPPIRLSSDTPQFEVCRDEAPKLR